MAFMWLSHNALQEKNKTLTFNGIRQTDSDSVLQTAILKKPVSNSKDIPVYI